MRINNNNKPTSVQFTDFVPGKLTCQHFQVSGMPCGKSQCSHCNWNPFQKGSWWLAHRGTFLPGSSVLESLCHDSSTIWEGQHYSLHKLTASSSKAHFLLRLSTCVVLIGVLYSKKLARDFFFLAVGGTATAASPWSEGWGTAGSGISDKQLAWSLGDDSMLQCIHFFTWDVTGLEPGIQ